MTKATRMADAYQKERTDSHDRIREIALEIGGVTETVKFFYRSEVYFDDDTYVLIHRDEKTVQIPPARDK